MDLRADCLVFADGVGPSESRSLAGVHVVPLPPGAANDVPGLAQVLRRELQAFCGSLRDVDVWAALSEEDCEVWHVRIPMVSRKEQENVAFWTAKKERVIDEARSVFDYVIGGKVVERGVPKRVVTALSGDRAALERMKALFAQAGFALKGATSPALAEQNLFSQNWINPDAEQFAILHVDDESTRIDLFSEGQLVVSRTIKTGIASFVRALMEGIAEAPAAQPEIRLDLPEGAPGAHPQPGLTEEQARCLLACKLTGQDDPRLPAVGRDMTPQQLFELIEPAVERLLRQLERTSDYFTNTLGYPALSRLYLSGSVAGFTPLHDYLSGQSGLASSPLDVSLGKVRQEAIVDIRRLSADGWDVASAVGLALSDESYTPNLLHTYKEKIVARKRRFTARVIAAACLLLAALTGIYGFGQLAVLSEKAEEKARLERELAAYGEYIPDEQAMRMAARAKELRALVAAAGERELAAAVISEVAALVPQPIQLTSLRMTLVKETPAEGGKKAKAAGEQEKEEAGSGIVVLTGQVMGDSMQREAVLAGFLYRLERSPLFLRLAIEKKADEQVVVDALQFVITLTLG